MDSEDNGRLLVSCDTDLIFGNVRWSFGTLNGRAIGPTCDCGSGLPAAALVVSVEELAACETGPSSTEACLAALPDSRHTKDPADPWKHLEVACGCQEASRGASGMEEKQNETRERIRPRREVNKQNCFAR